jgi:hypothetical protein
MAIDPATLAGRVPDYAKLARMLDNPDAYKAACERRMAIIDAWPVAFRLLVHEYGFNPVRRAVKAYGLRYPKVYSAVTGQSAASGRIREQLGDLQLTL